MAEKKIRAPKKKRMSGVFIVILIGIFILYMAIQGIIALNLSRIGTYEAREGYVEDSISVNGYMIRDEVIIPSPTDGIFVSQISDSEKVSNEQVVASIYKGHVDPKIQEQIRRLTERIEEKEAKRLQKDIMANDAVKIEQQISLKALDIISNTYSGNIQKLSAIKSDINKFIDKKMTILGEKKSDEEIIENLEETRDKLERDNNIEKIDITAPCAGVFVHKIDGFEQDLPVSVINNLLPSKLDALDDKKINSDHEVIADKPVCKIVSNFEWNFAASVDSQALFPLKMGDLVSLRFPDMSEQEMTAYVKYISQEENGKMAIVLSGRGACENIYSMRRVTVSVIKKKHKGLKVPTTAIRVIDGKQGVFIVRDKVARFKEVEISFNNKEWTIIKSEGKDTQLRNFDEVVISGNSVSDGKMVR